MKSLSKTARVAFTCMLFLATAACSRVAPAVRDGDIIFQTSKSPQSVAVQRAAVRAKMTERYGDAVPLDSTVISPSAIFDSPQLEVVARAGP
jgi:hypothetical protein